MADTMIQIAQDFSRFPGGRFIFDGPHSGELFREQILAPAIASGSTVTVVLDGVAGLPASFLEEAFGGLIRKGFKVPDLHRKLKIVAETKRLQRYPSQIWGYIQTAAASLDRVH
ncbi:STAS-like domain-containing protein [Methylobacterium sp. Leaf88]|uniref:STAS-like domain-containing protein n=1 Tax=Methylobacterium sp. Leaf88 TaxID=1736244 RepID=UPI00138F5A04|nr:STAS-like domain-containing protein [Methylobacterium sp. Leaf88]